MYELKDLTLDKLLDSAPSQGSEVQYIEERSVAMSQIAVIGLAGRVGEAENLDDFWKLIAEGRSGRRELPVARRKDFGDYLRLRGVHNQVSEHDYLKEAFLEEIDKFDYAFFGLSRQEANLMDPNQRLFLQTAWLALENAGYAGDDIKGSKTGVFVGHSSDFGQNYQHIIQTFSPDAPEISVAGNIKSIIASRIAYHLDLRGPSMLIDTACSSGLVSVHQACRSLRNGECELAIAGAVKIDLIPIEDKHNTGVGTRDIQETIAKDGKTRTFDDNSAGTSAAEGVLAFILKPLKKAMEDGDNIHCIINGSAINQDGLSVGITAPNSAAQEQLILAALDDANVAAEDVSYIEAHGTATRLGDPIEVSGIERAFRHFTKRKQFCGIGSVKTNIGHMDNAAGLAGLAKVIYALKHAQLPPSLYFDCPNQSIPFETSPVYVNDLLKSWPHNNEKKRIAGINSFGLSGTNCHVLVSEYSEAENSRVKRARESSLFVLSAKSSSQLVQYAKNIVATLENNPNNAGYNLEDICFTLSVGRLHHNYRLAIVANELAELQDALKDFVSNSPNAKLLVTDKDNSVADEQQRVLGEKVNNIVGSINRAATSDLEAIAKLYIRGAAVNWKKMYAGHSGYRRVALPGYPLAKSRCWVEVSEAAIKNSQAARLNTTKTLQHPLVDQVLAESYNCSVYRTNLSAAKNWELLDHKINHHHVLPGTAFIEMMLEALAQHLSNDGNISGFRFDRIQFLEPLVTDGAASCEVHIQLHTQAENYILSVCSRVSERWVQHAEAKVVRNTDYTKKTVDLEALKKKLNAHISFSSSDDEGRGLYIGERWHASFVRGWQNLEGSEFLVELGLPGQYQGETAHYHFHPALMDVAVNAVNHLLDEQILYLPFSYSGFQVISKIPPDIFVHLQLTDKSTELASLEIQLMDKYGELLALVKDYKVKRVPNTEFQQKSEELAYDIQMVEAQSDNAGSAAQSRFDNMILLTDDTSRELPFVKNLYEVSKEITEISCKDMESGVSSSVVKQCQKAKASIFTCALIAIDMDDSEEPLTLSLKLARIGGLLSMLMREKVNIKGPCVVFTRRGTATTNNQEINPVQAARQEFINAARLENPQLDIIAVDLGEADCFAKNSRLLASQLSGIDGKSICAAIHKEQVFKEKLVVKRYKQDKPFRLRDAGVYLISGGAGSLGLQLARRLASLYTEQQPSSALTLILTGTSQLETDIEVWQKPETKNTDRKHHNIYKVFAELTRQGVNLVYEQCDFSSEDQVRKLLEGIASNHGSLNGVVHAAGTAGAGFIVNKSAEDIARVVNGKALGAWWLHKYVNVDDLDFLVYYSSIATVLRNAGQSDYAAANRFLDALAQKRRFSGLPALSVRWPAWKETGIAVEFGAVDESEFFKPIQTEAALKKLLCLLSTENSRFSTLVLADINKQCSRDELDRYGLQADEEILRTLSRSTVDYFQQASLDVTIKGVATPTESQLAVARIWRKVLGATEIGIDEHFSDLGGNSILTTQLYNEYAHTYPDVFDMADLFSHTTISAQAALLESNIADSSSEEMGANGEDDIENILLKVSRGEISAEEAQALL